jgi:hypothetical protein
MSASSTVQPSIFLLQRVGGWYRFIYALLLGYFAALHEESPAPAAVEGR